MQLIYAGKVLRNDQQALTDILNKVYKFTVSLIVAGSIALAKNRLKAFLLLTAYVSSAQTQDPEVPHTLHLVVKTSQTDSRQSTDLPTQSLQSTSPAPHFSQSGSAPGSLAASSSGPATSEAAQSSATPALASEVHLSSSQEVSQQSASAVSQAGSALRYKQVARGGLA